MSAGGPLTQSPHRGHMSIKPPLRKSTPMRWPNRWCAWKVPWAWRSHKQNKVLSLSPRGTVAQVMYRRNRPKVQIWYEQKITDHLFVLLLYDIHYLSTESTLIPLILPNGRISHTMGVFSAHHSVRRCITIYYGVTMTVTDDHPTDTS